MADVASYSNLEVRSEIDATKGTEGALKVKGGIGAVKNITAGKDLKTQSGIVDFNDKVKVTYNDTDKCIEFNFQ